MTKQNKNILLFRFMINTVRNVDFRIKDIQFLLQIVQFVK